MNAFLKRLEWGVVEFLLALLIIAGLVGYVVHLPAEIEWLDHTISFIIFTVLFYRLNITEIVLGKKYHTADAFIVISFFLLFFKDMLALTASFAKEFTVFTSLIPLAELAVTHAGTIELITFHIAVAVLLCCSFWLAKNSSIIPSSMIYALTRERASSSFVFRFFLIFVCILAFYFFVYNMVLEWLEFTLDDPIIFVGIFYYLSLIVKHKEKFDKGNFVFKIGELADNVYSKFVLLFHYKHTLPLAISGILLLHGLADLSVFAYSYTIDKENIYLEALREYDQSFIQTDHQDLDKTLATQNHLSYKDLLTLDSLRPSVQHSPLHFGLLFYVYGMNIIALLSMLIIPVVTWYLIFTHKRLHMHVPLAIVLFMAFFTFASLPTFSLSALAGIPGVAGVDIQTHSVSEHRGLSSSLGYSFPESLFFATIMSILGGILAWFITLSHRGKRELYVVILVASLVFYGYYFTLFYLSWTAFLWSSMIQLWNLQYYVVAIVLWIFSVLSALFYLLGYLLFLCEIYAEYRHEKWTKLTQKTKEVIAHLSTRMENPKTPHQPELHH